MNTGFRTFGCANTTLQLCYLCYIAKLVDNDSNMTPVVCHKNLHDIFVSNVRVVVAHAALPSGKAPAKTVRCFNMHPINCKDSPQEIFWARGKMLVLENHEAVERLSRQSGVSRETLLAFEECYAGQKGRN